MKNKGKIQTGNGGKRKALKQINKGKGSKYYSNSSEDEYDFDKMPS